MNSLLDGVGGGVEANQVIACVKPFQSPEI